MDNVIFAKAVLSKHFISKYPYFSRDGAGVHNNFVRKKYTFATKTSG